MYQIENTIKSISAMCFQKQASFLKIVCLLCICSTSLIFGSSVHAVSIGEPLPDINVPLFGQEAEVPLAQLKDRVFLIDFWASWCIPCAKSFPHFEKLRSKYFDKGFEVFAISVDFEAGDVETFLQKHNVSFPIGWDPEGSLAKTFQVPGMPTSYLVGPDGLVKSIHKGFTEKHAVALDLEIEQLLTTP